MLEHWKIRVWFWSRLELIFWHSRASIDQGFISPRHIRLKVAAQRAPESCWTICIVSRDRVTGVSSTMLCHNLFAPQMFPRFFTPVTESAFSFLCSLVCDILEYLFKSTAERVQLGPIYLQYISLASQSFRLPC